MKERRKKKHWWNWRSLLFIGYFQCVTLCPVTLPLFFFILLTRIFNQEENDWPLTSDVQTNNRREIQLLQFFFSLETSFVQIFIWHQQVFFHMIKENRMKFIFWEKLNIHIVLMIILQWIFKVNLLCHIFRIVSKELKRYYHK